MITEESLRQDIDSIEAQYRGLCCQYDRQQTSATIHAYGNHKSAVSGSIQAARIAMQDGEEIVVILCLGAARVALRDLQSYLGLEVLR